MTLNRSSYYPLLICPVLILSTVPMLTGGERVSVGVRGGVPLTDAFKAARGSSEAYLTNTKRYLLGPALEVHLPARLTLQVDGLYRRLGYHYDATGPYSYAKTVANSWEFPVLGKFEITPGPVRPFAEAGVSFRHLSGVRQIRETVSGVTLGRVEVSEFPEFNKQNDVGFTCGAGLTFKLGAVRISPEFRYTRWGGEAFRDPVRSLLRTNRNQGDFILGLTL
jgi:opacity protein-like surface antigen